jgi:GntR family transcriptional regulator
MYQSTSQRPVTVEQSRRRPPVRAADGKLAEEYIYMKRVHSSNDLPYCVISLYLEDKIFSMSPGRFRNELVIPVLASLSPQHIAKARQTLTIGSADAETARLLRVPIDAPVARVQRVFNDADGVVIYYADVVYRGDAVKVEMDLGSVPS